jgi:hypothetical protein
MATIAATPRARVAFAALPVVAAVLSSTVFVALQVPVGDLWAARAREFAAAHGVGLDYWFGWFGGATPPGAYSVVVPFLSTFIGAAALGAVATVAITLLCRPAVRGSAHPLAATWVVTVAAGFDLWSGRIAFTVGTAGALIAVIAIRRRWWVLAVLAGVFVVLASPVAGVFLAIALTGTLWLAKTYRLLAGVVLATTLVTLAVLGLVYGSIGAEPFDWPTANALILALCAMAIARPKIFVVVPVLVSAVVCVVLAAMPTPMGGNFDRMVWIWLPPAVVATARRSAVVTLACVSLGVYGGISATMGDLRTAFGPVAQTAQYEPLLHRLDRLPGLAQYRLEVIPDGTHDASDLLLPHALLARGYETQVDLALNPTVTSGTLTADQYRTWLDTNAVGYVLLHRQTLYENAEYQLVQSNTTYLTPIWSNAQWDLYAVRAPVPIAGRPDRMVDADQNELVISAPHKTTVALRVRWSSVLDADGSPGVQANLRPDGHGWTLLHVSAPGQVTVTG